MKNEGWISLHRKIQDNRFYPKNRPFTQFEAWIDLLLNANYADQEVNIKFETFVCKRGQSLRSQLTLSRKWNWDRSAVRRFLKLLETDHQIDLKTTNESNNKTTIKTTMITICNYDKYQRERPTDEPTNEPTSASQTISLNNINKEYMVDFATFWNLYDKKNGDKLATEMWWDKLSPEDKIKVIEVLPAYKKTIKDKQYQPYPKKFLKERRWENEDLLHGSKEELDTTGKPRPGNQYTLVNGKWTVL